MDKNIFENVNRRRFLTKAAQTSALTAALSFFPKAMAQVTAEPVRPKQIEHVVMLMQENRSFDHYFGTMNGVVGYGDPNALILSTGKSVFYQPDVVNPAGYTLPFHLDTKKTSAQKIPSTSHAWSVQSEAYNHGAMDMWLPAHRKADGKNGPYVMGYYERQDIPFHYALADAYTLCDAYHCSMLGPTWPNRMYWMTGTIDPTDLGGGPITSNVEIPGGYRWTTYAERLEKAGVNWKVYAETDDYGCNVLKYFKSFKEASPSSSLYQRGVSVSSAGTFEEQAAKGTLPTVSWIIPTSWQSEHPAYRPADGAAFLASKINAVASNPDLWAKTVFFIMYDENDGLFDHVVPPAPAPGTPLEFIDNKQIGAGYRVPCFVISPWSIGGYVSTEKFDHTSCLMFLENLTGVLEPNISPWRRKTFGNLTSTLQYGLESTAKPVYFQGTAKEISDANDEESLPKPVAPPAIQSMPVQQQGARKQI